MTTVRRIVTAQTEDGRNVFAKIEDVEPWQARVGWHPVWSWTETPTLPFAPPADDYMPTYTHPETGGVAVVVTEFPVGMGVDPSIEPVTRDLEKYRQLSEANGKSGTHTPTGGHGTDTIDIAFVISGEIGLEQDDGEEVTLRPGDVLLQMGALHTWRNRGSEPCLMGFVLVGTDRVA